MGCVSAQAGGIQRIGSRAAEKLTLKEAVDDRVEIYLRGSIRHVYCFCTGVVGVGREVKRGS